MLIEQWLINMFLKKTENNKLTTIDASLVYYVATNTLEWYISRYSTPIYMIILFYHDFNKEKQT